MSWRRTNRDEDSGSESSSVEDLLKDVQNFVDGIYRGLHLSPPCRSNDVRSAPQPAANNFGRCFDADRARINQHCRTVNRNLNSIGININSPPPSPNSNAGCVVHLRRNSERREAVNRPRSRSQSRSPVADRNSDSNSRTPSLPSSSSNPDRSSIGLMAAGLRRRRFRLGLLLTEDNPVIDLSNSPEAFNRSASSEQNDDVVMVSTFPPQVVDLCSPTITERSGLPGTDQQLTGRRRLYQRSVVANADSTSEKHRSRKRHTDSSFVPSRNTCLAGNEAATSDEGRTPFMCPVCMESYVQRQPTSTLCGHVYCKECIERALKHTQKCPMCNKKISNKRIFRIYV